MKCSGKECRVPVPCRQPGFMRHWSLTHHVNVKIDGQTATTSVDQEFLQSPIRRCSKAPICFPIPQRRARLTQIHDGDRRQTGGGGIVVGRQGPRYLRETLNTEIKGPGPASNTRGATFSKCAFSLSSRTAASASRFPIPKCFRPTPAWSVMFIRSTRKSIRPNRSRTSASQSNLTASGRSRPSVFAL